MTRRDLGWRVAGGALSIGGCVASLLDRGSPLTLLYLIMALSGLALMVNGKRVAIVWKAERRGHCNTASVVRAERVRRHCGAKGCQPSAVDSRSGSTSLFDERRP